jgi:hypothetical protein
MLDYYLLSLFTLMLSEYGFQTRKQAMAKLTSRWQWRRIMLRVLLWTAALLGWFLRSGDRWPVIIVFAVGVVAGELCAVLIHRWTRKDVAGNYPLSRPQIHILPFLFALLPAIAGGLLLHDLFPPSIGPISDVLTIVLKVITSVVAMFCWSTVFTVSIIGLVRSSRFSDEIEPHLGAGEVIGILERLFTLLLVSSGGLTAVGFAVAAKAAARYPQFKNPNFAEYFLIGTLCSIGVSVIVGIAIQSF